jgi:hypothetical protein
MGKESQQMQIILRMDRLNAIEKLVLSKRNLAPSSLRVQMEACTDYGVTPDYNTRHRNIQLGLEHMRDQRALTSPFFVLGTSFIFVYSASIIR